jgi:hypothetical protein
MSTNRPTRPIHDVLREELDSRYPRREAILEAIAEKLDGMHLSAGTLSDALSGSRPIGPKTLFALLMVLGWDLDDLYRHNATGISRPATIELVSYALLGARGGDPSQGRPEAVAVA